MRENRPSLEQMGLTDKEKQGELKETRPEQLKKLGSKFKYLRRAVLATTLVFGGRGMTPVVENTNYGTGEEKAEKVVETVMIAPGATALKAMDDIRGMLHSMGVEDVPDAETSSKITLKEPTTFRELAQQRIFQLYSLGSKDESQRFGPMRTLQAETFASHLGRINNKNVNEILPIGTEIVIDDEVVAPGHAQESWEPTPGKFDFKNLDLNE